MEKASQISLDMIVKEITENEMGILLLEWDGVNLMDILIKQASYKDRIGIFGDGRNITCHIFPIMYKRYPNIDDTLAHDIVDVRFNAVYNLFDRWNALGYNKHHAKSPFGCKAFIEYRKNIGFSEADYLLLLVN